VSQPPPPAALVGHGKRDDTLGEHGVTYADVYAVERRVNDASPGEYDPPRLLLTPLLLPSTYRPPSPNRAPRTTKRRARRHARRTCIHARRRQRRRAVDRRIEGCSSSSSSDAPQLAASASAAHFSLQQLRNTPSPSVHVLPHIRHLRPSPLVCSTRTPSGPFRLHRSTIVPGPAPPDPPPPPSNETTPARSRPPPWPDQRQHESRFTVPPVHSLPNLPHHSSPTSTLAQPAPMPSPNPASPRSPMSFDSALFRGRINGNRDYAMFRLGAKPPHGHFFMIILFYFLLYLLLMHETLKYYVHYLCYDLTTKRS
jgi:hypothetical protein